MKETETKVLINVYSVGDLKYYGCNDNLIEKVFSLPTDKYYEVCKDRQGGHFGMYRIMSIRDWVSQAIEWLYHDESDVNQDWLMYDDYNKVLEAIEDFWEIEFEEVKEGFRFFLDSLVHKAYETKTEITNAIASIFGVEEVPLEEVATNSKGYCDDFHYYSFVSKFKNGYVECHITVDYLETRKGYWYVTDIRPWITV